MEKLLELKKKYAWDHKDAERLDAALVTERGKA